MRYQLHSKKRLQFIKEKLKLNQSQAIIRVNKNCQYIITIVILKFYTIKNQTRLIRFCD